MRRYELLQLGLLDLVFFLLQALLDQCSNENLLLIHEFLLLLLQFQLLALFLVQKFLHAI